MSPPTGTPTPAPAPSPTPTATPTPTPTPLQPSTLPFTITIDPPDPQVGDVVTLRAAAFLEGGVPQYTLRIVPRGESVVTLESPESVTDVRLGREVVWNLRATGPGVVTLQVHVNYEREVCLPNHCFYGFTGETSDRVTLSVAQTPSRTSN